MLIIKKVSSPEQIKREQLKAKIQAINAKVNQPGRAVKPEDLNEKMDIILELLQELAEGRK